MHVYFVHTFIGSPKETEEMKPQWFLHKEIPYQHMWANDPYWLPRVLSGEKLMGKVWFKEDARNIEKMEWNTVVEF